MEPVMKFPHVCKEKKGKYTNFYVQSTDAKSRFGQRVVRKGALMYKQVDPSRSKLFAGIAKGISQIGFKEDSVCLYLGASHGYTVSFLADMLAKGYIFAMDFAPRVMRDLVFLAEEKKNIAPFMADANQPQIYKAIVPQVDVVFMDIAQKNQLDIFTKNCDMFLKQGGFGLLALKSRSVDVTKKPKLLFKEVRAQLEKLFIVVDYRELAPYEDDHALYVVKKR